MAIDGTYEFSVDMGGKTQTGTAKVATDGDVVTATVQAPIVGTVKATGKKTGDNEFFVSGSVRVLLKRVNFDVVARLEGDKLYTSCTSNMGAFDLVGTRIS